MNMDGGKATEGFEKLQFLLQQVRDFPQTRKQEKTKKMIFEKDKETPSLPTKVTVLTRCNFSQAKIGKNLTTQNNLPKINSTLFFPEPLPARDLREPPPPLLQVRILRPGGGRAGRERAFDIQVSREIKRNVFLA